MNKTRRYTVHVVKELTMYAESSEEAIQFADALTAPDMGEMVMIDVVDEAELSDSEQRDIQDLNAAVAEDLAPANEDFLQ